jgi:hypothetical protein
MSPYIGDADILSQNTVEDLGFVGFLQEREAVRNLTTPANID